MLVAPSICETLVRMVQRSMHYVASSYAPRLRQRLATGSIVREIAEKGDRLCTSAAPDVIFDHAGRKVQTSDSAASMFAMECLRVHTGTFLVSAGLIFSACLFCLYTVNILSCMLRWTAKRIDNDDERLSAVPVRNQQSSPNLRTLAFRNPRIPLTKTPERLSASLRLWTTCRHRIELLWLAGLRCIVGCRVVLNV